MVHTTVSGGAVIRTAPGVSLTGSGSKLCPDLLRLDAIGAADNLRGRVVRLFFRVMEWWPT